MTILSFANKEHKFSAFHRQISNGFVKIDFYVFIGTFWGKLVFFFERKHNLPDLLRTLSRNIIIFRKKIFSGVVKTGFYVFIGTIWGKTIFFRNKKNTICLTSSGHWAVFFFFRRKFLGGFIKTGFILRVHKNFLEDVFSGKSCFYRFRTLSETFLNLSWKKIRLGCQTAFYVSIWLTRGRKNLWENCSFLSFSDND